MAAVSTWRRARQTSHNSCLMIRVGFFGAEPQNHASWNSLANTGSVGITNLIRRTAFLHTANMVARLRSSSGQFICCKQVVCKAKRCKRLIRKGRCAPRRWRASLCAEHWSKLKSFNKSGSHSSKSQLASAARGWAGHGVHRIAGGRWATPDIIYEGWHVPQHRGTR